MSREISKPVTIGILAIQGAVSEHEDALKSLGASTVQIRNPEDFENCDGIVLPGGESTTMAIVGEENGLFPKLKSWVQSNKPIWGTCAGMILLSDHAIKTALGGQSLVGGLDVHVCRNYFGSQIHSCILDIKVPDEIQPPTTAANNDSNNDSSESDKSMYPAVFIRAPAILATGSSVRVLSTVTAQPHISAKEEVEGFFLKVEQDEKSNNSSSLAKDTATPTNKKQKKNSPSSSSTLPASSPSAASSSSASDNTSSSSSSNSNSHEVIVAVRKDNILATAFHPELTMPVDLRWHQYFLTIVKESIRTPAVAIATESSEAVAMNVSNTTATASSSNSGSDNMKWKTPKKAKK